MENTINKIINIEEQAQAIMRDAQNLKNSLDSDINKKVNEMKHDIEKRVSAKYETIQKKEAEYTEQKTEEIKKQYAAAKENLETIYREKEHEWVDSIYKAALGIE